MKRIRFILGGDKMNADDYQYVPEIVKYAVEIDNVNGINTISGIVYCEFKKN